MHDFGATFEGRRGLAMLEGRLTFEELKSQLYDKIRRLTLDEPNAFDGPRAIYTTDSDRVVDLKTFVENDSEGDANNFKDAYFDAIEELRAEGFVEIAEGKVHLRARQALSDRTVDAFEDHHSAGRKIEEIPFAVGPFDAAAQLVDLCNLPRPLRDVVAVDDFPLQCVMYNRAINVNDETWAITYSAVYPKQTIEDEINRRGILAALNGSGIVPSQREEHFIVRFPYEEERVLLALPAHLWRLPLIVGLGRIVSAEGLPVEKYVNIMRADRYIIESKLQLASGFDSQIASR